MRHARLVLVLPLALALLTGCADDGGDTDAVAPAASSATTPQDPVVVAVAEDDGKDAVTAAVAVGQLAQLDLATCGGCGFSWTVDAAPDAAVAVEEDVPETEAAPAPAASGPPLVGVPTTTSLGFRGTAAGTTTVSVGYHPPGGGPAERTVVLTITVS